MEGSHNQDGIPLQYGPNENMNPELSLSSLPVSVDSQSSLTSFGSPNTSLVSGHSLGGACGSQGGGACSSLRGDKCDDVRAELRAFKTEMEEKVFKLSEVICERDKELKQVHKDLELTQRELDLIKREKQLDECEAEKKMRAKDEEINRLNQQNDKLEKEVETLKEEKEGLEENIRTLQCGVETLTQKVDNLHNQNQMGEPKREQCDHTEELKAMFDGFAQSTFEKLAEKFSSMETGPVSSFLSVGGKLDKYKSGSSKSNTPSPSVSPANSDHSFKPPTPPPPAGNDQLVPGSEAQ